MKNITYIILTIFLIASCSSDSTDSGFSNGNGQGGSLARFKIVNDHLYTVDNSSLNVFDISNPQLPVKVNDVYVGFSIETIYHFESNLYLGSTLGMYIYDITQPSNPVLLSSVNHARSCDPVVSNFTHTFVTLHTSTSCEGTINQLEIYDTADPTTPVLLTTVQFERPIGMGLYNDILILSDKDFLRFLDISNPQFPQEIHSIEIDSFDVIVRNDELYVVGDTQLTQFELDSNDITQTAFLSSISF